MPGKISHSSSPTGGDTSGADNTNNTMVSPSTELFLDISHPPSPQQPTADPAPISDSSKPLVYFEHHREDRLMGAFTGYAPPRFNDAPQIDGGATSVRSILDTELLGVGAWTEDETHRS